MALERANIEVTKSSGIQPALLLMGVQESYRAKEVWPMGSKAPLHKHLQGTLES